MPALATFTDFLTATKVHKLTSATDILQEAVKQEYFLSRMLKGQSDAFPIVRGGQSIKDDIILRSAGSFRFYNPNFRSNVTDVDVLTAVTVGWRFAVTHYGYNDETISLNEGQPEDTWTNLKRSKESACEADQWNGMEEALWAVPAYGGMEAGTGSDDNAPPAYSIPVFVNEYTNGVPTGWTGNNIMGVDASTETRWRPQRSQYNSATPADENGGLVDTMEDMYLKVRFRAPTSGQQYMQSDDLQQMVIATNRDGVKMTKRMLALRNDWTRMGPTDVGAGAPLINGLPVEYVTQLDTAALDLANTAAWPTGSPRFFFLNLKFLVPVYHSTGYMQQVGPKDGGIGQPFSHAVFFRTWYNIFCRSRQRQGIVYPT